MASDQTTRPRRQSLGGLLLTGAVCFNLACLTACLLWFTVTGFLAVPLAPITLFGSVTGLTALTTRRPGGHR